MLQDVKCACQMHDWQLLIQAHFAQLMSDSDEFEYESDDDPYGGAEEEAMLSV